MNDIKQIIESIIAIIVLLCTIAVILGYPLMLLWNWLMPTIFNLPEITFWQAIGLNFLSTILFKSSSLVKKEE